MSENRHGYQPKSGPSLKPPAEGPTASSNVKPPQQESITVTIVNLSTEVRSAIEQGVMNNLTIGYVIPKPDDSALVEEADKHLSSARNALRKTNDVAHALDQIGKARRILSLINKEN